MSVADVVVVVVAAVVSVGLWRFFFGARTASHAELLGGVQEVTVTVKGGYSPDRIEVRQGIPAPAPRATALSATHDGRDSYFCSPHCRDTFTADPAAHLTRS